MHCGAHSALILWWIFWGKVDGLLELSTAILEAQALRLRAIMAAPTQLMPFKAKVEERAVGSATTSVTEVPPKRQCTAYDKQIQKMDGNVQLIKDYILN